MGVRVNAIATGWIQPLMIEQGFEVMMSGPSGKVILN